MCGTPLAIRPLVRPLIGLLIGLLLLPCAGCGNDPGAAAALATFARFQDALFARDARAARRLVTGESAPVVDAMPWDRIAARPRLVAVDASDERGSWHVHFRDPADGGRPGSYVVVRENGRWCVDLVATAGLFAERGADAGIPVFEPRELDAADRALLQATALR